MPSFGTDHMPITKPLNCSTFMSNLIYSSAENLEFYILDDIDDFKSLDYYSN